MWCHSTMIIVLVATRPNAKLNVQDLNDALENQERLDRLPDTIETNVIYRLALASNTKGQSFYSSSSRKRVFLAFRCIQS